MDNEQYLALLKQDLKQGLMDEKEYGDALEALGISESSHSFTCFDADLDNFQQVQIIRRFAENYYREIFDEVPDIIDEDTPGINVILGEEKSKIRGAIWTVAGENLEGRMCTVVRRMYVRPEYRSSGMGSQLLHASLEGSNNIDYIKLFSWEKAVPFYHHCGFLMCDEEEKENSQTFYKMILPLKKAIFEQYQRERSSGWFEGLSDYLTPQEWKRFMQGVGTMKGYQRKALHRNPFTMFVFKSLNLPHELLNP